MARAAARFEPSSGHRHRMSPMRLVPAIAFAAAFQAASALADPKADSEALYKVTVAVAPVLMELAGNIDDAEFVVAEIEMRIDPPLVAAEQRWMDAAFGSGTSSAGYEPFAACLEASSALYQFSAKVQRYLQLIDKQPFTAADADPFRKALARCETALGVK
jgi:hypothetical protein